MEIFKPTIIKTSNTSQQKRSAGAHASSVARLRLVPNPAVNSAPVPAPLPSENTYLAVRFNHYLHAVKDSLTEQQIQPMMARSFLESAKQQMLEQPEQAVSVQANSMGDVVSALLA